jgi:hypothetical protein
MAHRDWLIAAIGQGSWRSIGEARTKVGWYRRGEDEGRLGYEPKRPMAYILHRHYNMISHIVHVLQGMTLGHVPLRDRQETESPTRLTLIPY